MRDEVYSSFGEPTLEQRYLVVSVVAGLSAGSAPGGVVFNYSGVPATPYGTIWSVGFQ
ncbi:hypothetical protein [Leuconostoc mesenteroides]|uniref:hypothetical protein n=1 Tax=Leuconostoc mesenteroides TaxID=1245 RepID=UPI00235DC47B|nr:hypothetical protein [Leuconostoc mesenteroides]